MFHTNPLRRLEPDDMPADLDCTWDQVREATNGSWDLRWPEEKSIQEDENAFFGMVKINV